MRHTVITLVKSDKSAYKFSLSGEFWKKTTVRLESGPYVT